MNMRLRFALAALAAWSGMAAAGEDLLELKDAPGREKVEAGCVQCHSLDYIQMNSPFLDRKGWEAAVNKMIRVMGADIAPDDAKLIVEYLTTNYGK